MRSVRWELGAMMKLPKRDGLPVALILAVALGLIVLAIALPVGAQSQESDDPLELYDANDNGVIDVDEIAKAI